MNYGLKDKVVAVTGGASGIGRAACELLAGEGAIVAVIDRDPVRNAETVARLRQQGAVASGYHVDVSQETDVSGCVTSIEQEFGPVYGLIVAAGISVAALAEDLKTDDWERVFKVNALGAFLCCRAFGAAMLSRRAGAIVVIGSIDGIGAQPGRTAYASSKFAVHGLVKSLAAEWANRGVRVNCVAPGLVDTPLLRTGMPARFVDAVVDRTPMGRIARPEDIASVAAMLLSSATNFVNGVIIPVDGGLLASPFTRKNGADLSSNRLLEAGIYTED
ncbi:SDR family oxidoreductase [Paraburkholderia sp. LEh10]|uniref:SDR family NAD(P)-dependent oxidoreductase n=1 Tax=Paraburkholderia sp. LEh10 TaxID=2821353 RepID=UPI001AE726A4|nr:SDR family NAD(P)-dependent oxidoreductase [Paraburkholderia sp. LEh10]MBP0590472.1 SDR family oxidoreductase [Paraburkholderia sp. LEh10]